MARHYGVPLTDPRLDLYTDELLMIEFEFLRKEHPDWFKDEQYHDPSYEAWVAKVSAEDARIVRDRKELEQRIIKQETKPEKLNLDDDEEWEEVAIDDGEDPPTDE